MTRDIDYAIILHTTQDQDEIVSISIYFSSKKYHCLKIENALSSVFPNYIYHIWFLLQTVIILRDSANIYVILFTYNRCFVLDITYNLRK